MKKKLLSLLLTVVMLVAMLPGAALAADTVDWAGAMNFNDANNQVTSTSSLTAANWTKMNWAYPLNTKNTYYNAYYAGQPVIVDGYLYATGAGMLHKVDIATGEGEVIVTTGVGGDNHYYDYLCYAEVAGGMLVVASENGETDKLEVFDLNGERLDSVTGSLGYYLPVQYHDGYIICNGHIFQLTQSGQLERVGSGTIGGAAFNWSSGVFLNNLFYVAAETTVYAVDYTTGTVKYSYEFDADRNGYNDTQGGVAYDAETKRLFWGTYDYNTALHSIVVNADGTFGEYQSIDIGEQSVCTPVISDGKVYIGAQSGNICVYDITTGVAASYPTYGGAIKSGLIVSVVGDATRVYAQGFDGHLYMLEGETVTQLARTANYTGVTAPNAFEQIAMDSEGNIYCYNQSGYLFSFGVSECEVPIFATDLSTETIKYDYPEDGEDFPVAQALSVVMQPVSDGVVQTFQWEKRGEDDTEFVDIADAAGSSYTPDISKPSKIYYRCKVTNTAGDVSESVYSEVAEVWVKDLSDNTKINIAINSSNNVSEASPVAAELSGSAYRVERADIPTNIWIGTQDYNRVTGFEIVQGAAATPGFTEKTDGNVWNGVTYDGYYRSASYSYPLTANIEVTAEDDTVATYKLVITEDGDYTPSLYVTIVSDGEVVVAQQELTVTDYNSDGVTVDDALYAAHEAAYDDGADAGYGSEYGQYGLGLTKLWGKGGSFGYWLNNGSCWSLADEVFAGDHVVAFVYENSNNAYAKFDSFSYSATVDSAFVLDLSVSGYDADWNIVWSSLANADIIAYDSEMDELAADDYTVTNDGKGKYSVTFSEDGTYYLVASYAGQLDESGNYIDAPIVPAVCQVTVKSVYVTIADAGQTVLAMQKVNFADYNGNGIFDVDDALYAAHEAEYEGGAEAGYASEEGEYGLGLTKLWGDTSRRYGYWLNNASCWSLTDEVTGGDHLVAFVYKDAGWSDAYSYFDSLTYSAKVESELSLDLKAVQWVGSVAVHNSFAGATITAYDSNMTALDAESYAVNDDGAGKYSVTFSEVGTYYLVGSYNGIFDEVAGYYTAAPIVSAVCEVTVTEDGSTGSTGNTGDTVAPTTMTVTFSMITHNDTWIEEHDITLSLGATVYDAFHKVVDRRSGFSYEANDYYVRSITYKGTKLGEFDMGPNSGWKYMVNGVASGVGMDSRTLDDGDELVWYYVEDYTEDTDRDEGNFSTVVVPEEEIIVDAEQAFSDIEGHWALEAISYVCENGLMKGVTEDEFAPNDPLSRAMLVTILYRLESEPDIDAENLYQDVVNGAWYTDAILWASANGIVQGHGEGGFAPNDNVTREQIAAILMRYSEYKKYDVTQGGMGFREYPDYEQIAEWARPNIQWATAVGLISGDENGMLNPQGDATRAEAATILMRYLKEYVGLDPEQAA